ncbi:hypothetical protein [Hymenobacter sp. PAMC 26628]|uniref:hypothetical protein n=1 Tax=Hymenobacter sp. PAMC 26628 TaxID=1484118 RepID=UPI000770345D|nr:hypothetical protein [Hymenobacter sp. PAMC 26628]AMJ65045.1 hypothetical protein AXW84_06090 [Hymenobacter sp. PAMC 26628]
MSEATTEQIELSQHQTRNWLLMGIVGALVLMVQGFFTYVITSTGAEVKETNRGLNDLVSTVKVQQVQQDWLRDQIAQLNAARKDAAEAHKNYDIRLNGLEQAVALQNQWIQSHNPGK